MVGIARIDQPHKHNHGFFVRVQRAGKIPHSSPTKNMAAGGKPWSPPRHIAGSFSGSSDLARIETGVGGRRYVAAKVRPGLSVCRNACCDAATCRGSIGWRPGVPGRMLSRGKCFRCGSTVTAKPNCWPFALDTPACGTWNESLKL
jgi:hypothetical protein